MMLGFCGRSRNGRSYGLPEIIVVREGSCFVLSIAQNLQRVLPTIMSFPGNASQLRSSLGF